MYTNDIQFQENVIDKGCPVNTVLFFFKVNKNHFMLLDLARGFLCVLLYV